MKESGSYERRNSMRRNSKAWRDSKKEMCRVRDGAACSYCGKPEGQYYQEKSKPFDLCHFDGNCYNNADENLKIGCHQCNCQAEVDRIAREGRFSNVHNMAKLKASRNIYTYINTDTPRIRSAEFAKSIIAHPKLLSEVRKIFSGNEEIEREELINALSNISDLSRERIISRLKTWCNRINGHLEEVNHSGDSGMPETYIKKSTRYSQWEKES